MITTVLAYAWYYLPLGWIAYSAAVALLLAVAALLALDAGGTDA